MSQFLGLGSWLVGSGRWLRPDNKERGHKAHVQPAVCLPAGPATRDSNGKQNTRGAPGKPATPAPLAALAPPGAPGRSLRSHSRVAPPSLLGCCWYSLVRGPTEPPLRPPQRPRRRFTIVIGFPIWRAFITPATPSFTR